MLRRLTRALLLLAAVAATVPLPSLAVGLLADGEPVICGCGCGREVGSCCCAAPKSSDLAMRCNGDRDEGETPVVYRPPAVTGSEAAFPGPTSGRQTTAAEPCRPWSVDLEPDPPVPESAAVR